MSRPAVIRRPLTTGATTVGRRLWISPSWACWHKELLPFQQPKHNSSPRKAYSNQLRMFVQERRTLNEPQTGAVS